LRLLERLEQARTDGDKKYLSKLIFVIKLLCTEAKALYDLIIIPEIDVFQIRDLIEKAIKSFKK
jgi:hypothetical protein